MLSALLASPLLLDGSGNGDTMTRAEHDKRVSSSRRASLTGTALTDLETAAFAGHPSMRERRRSLGLEEDAGDSASNEIPPAAAEDAIVAVSAKGTHSRHSSAGSSTVMPYMLKADPAVDGSNGSNGLPLVDLNTLFAGATTSTATKGLTRAALHGFASSQRGEIWPRALVLPSSVTYVDVSPYYAAVEAAFRLATFPGAAGGGGALTRAAAGLAQAEAQQDAHGVAAARQEINEGLPTNFPAPPLLGRTEPFDFAHVDASAYADVASARAQQRILCVLSHAQGSSLSFAPQLAPLVALVYSALGKDEPRTYAWCNAMLERSKRDEFFMAVSPLSMELYVRGFERLVDKHLPELAQHLSSFGLGAGANHLDTPLVRTWFRSWSSNLFLGSLPPEACARMMDLLVIQGFGAACYKLGLQCLATYEPYLLSTTTRTGSGEAGRREMTNKIDRLMSVANVDALLGPGEGAGGMSWHSENTMYSKTDLAKLSVPTGPIVLDAPLDSNTKNASTSLANTLAFGSSPFHMPSFFSSSSCSSSSSSSSSPAHESILDERMLFQLYSGILAPPEATKDPVCVHNSFREGHSLRAMLGKIRAHMDENEHLSGGGGSTGILFLIQDSQGRVYGLCVQSWPRTIPSEESIALEGGGFVCSFAAEATGPKVLRWSGSTPSSAIANVPAALAPSVPAREASPPQMELLPVDATDSSAGTSLPILPVERPGQGGDRRSSITAALLGGDGSSKRRGSLALILDALKITRSAEDEIERDQGPLAAQLIASMPQMSPFRHVGVRLVLGAELESMKHKKSGSTSTAASAAPSRPVSPRAGATDSAASSASSTVAPSLAASAVPSPALSRRQSLVDGLGKAWKFIQTVPTPSHSNGSSANSTPSTSRRGSAASFITSAGSAIPSRSPIIEASASTPAHKQRYSTMPSPGTPPSSTRSVRSTGLISSRNASVSVSQAGESPPSSLPGASPVSTGSHRPRAATLGSVGLNAPLTGLERHLALQKARESGWDAQASSPAASSRRLSLKPPASPLSQVPSPSMASTITPTAVPASVKEEEKSTESTPATTPSAAELYIRALASPAQANALSAIVSPLPRHTPSSSSRRGSGMAKPLLMRALSDGHMRGGSSSTNELSIPVAEPVARRVSSALPVQAAVTPVAASSPLPGFASTCASFRAQHGFHLSVDDGDGDGTAPTGSPPPHCDTVRAGLNSMHSELAGIESRAAAPSGARMLLCGDSLLLTESSHSLVWSLNGTLEQSVLQCPALGLQAQIGGVDAPPMDVAIVECWTFQ